MNTHHTNRINRTDHVYQRDVQMGNDTRFLLASVGTTPGTSALFVGTRRVHERPSRHTLRSMFGRRVHDHGRAPSRFADENAADFNDVMGRRGTSPSPVSDPRP